MKTALSVVANPSEKHQDYGKWLGDKKPETYRDKLRKTINEIMAKQPANFDQFLKMMSAAGYEIKQGEHLAFRAKGQQKFTRLRSLGEGYTEKDINAAIRGKIIFAPKKQNKSRINSNKINLLVDIQAKLQAGKGAGYERWAKIFNLKQMAKTIAFLKENQIEDYEELIKMSQAATIDFHQLSQQIKLIEAQINEARVNRKNEKSLDRPVSPGQILTTGMGENATNRFEELLKNKRDLLTKYREQKVNLRELQTVLANTKAIIVDDIHDKTSKSVSR